MPLRSGAGAGRRRRADSVVSMTEARTTYTATDLTAAAHERFEVGLASARSAVSEHGLMIGHASQPGSLEPVTERNPARLDERLGQFAQGSDEDIARAVAAARASQPAWAQRTIDERIDVLEGVAGEVARRAGMLAAVLTLEVGKTRLESVGEVDESVELIRYYCGCAAAGFDLRLDGEPGTRNLSVMRPFGVFGVIVPFNFP
ncbi:MAG: aldehyde dehydrogenase family protein, partial [Chloroflexi bacterium]